MSTPGGGWAGYFILPKTSSVDGRALLPLPAAACRCLPAFPSAPKRRSRSRQRPPTTTYPLPPVSLRFSLRFPAFSCRRCRRRCRRCWFRRIFAYFRLFPPNFAYFRLQTPTITSRHPFPCVFPAFPPAFPACIPRRCRRCRRRCWFLLLTLIFAYFRLQTPTNAYNHLQSPRCHLQTPISSLILLFHRYFIANSAISSLFHR